jgi:hypothetical protein
MEICICLSNQSWYADDTRPHASVDDTAVKTCADKRKTNFDNPQSQVYPPDRIVFFYKKK